MLRLGIFRHLPGGPGQPLATRNRPFLNSLLRHLDFQRLSRQGVDSGYWLRLLPQCRHVLLEQPGFMRCFLPLTSVWHVNLHDAPNTAASIPPRHFHLQDAGSRTPGTSALLISRLPQRQRGCEQYPSAFSSQANAGGHALLKVASFASLLDRSVYNSNLLQPKPIWELLVSLMYPFPGVGWGEGNPSPPGGGEPLPSRLTAQAYTLSAVMSTPPSYQDHTSTANTSSIPMVRNSKSASVIF